jgi:hypothetical protein
VSKPIVLTEAQWRPLHQQIARDYPASVLLIQDRTRAVLGFTVRHYREWVKDTGHDGYGNYQETIRLDFYDEKKRLMFLLKYTEFLENKNEHGSLHNIW